MRSKAFQSCEDFTRPFALFRCQPDDSMHVHGFLAVFSLVVPNVLALQPQLQVKKTANTIIRKWDSFSELSGHSLALRQESGCGVAEKVCGSGCVPTTAVCCNGIKYKSIPQYLFPTLFPVQDVWHDHTDRRLSAVRGTVMPENIACLTGAARCVRSFKALPWSTRAFSSSDTRLSNTDRKDLYRHTDM